MFESILPEPVHPSLTWRYWVIPPGEALTGYVTGPMVGVMTHFRDGRTKPCHRCFTKGALPCYFKGDCKPRWTGYVPVITDPDRAHVVLVVPRTTGTALRQFGPGSCLRFVRPTHPRHPLWVRSAELSSRTISRDLFHRRAPDDIKPWLMHLWRDETLNQWVAAQQNQRDAM